ncbi:MAG TPA: hypothetical protein VIM11_28175 [Tepidisphaeraceae bacterium]
MRRHLVTLICGISLIFCLGTLLLRLHAVAVADYLHCDSYRLKSGLVYRSKWDLESAGGQLGLWFSQDSNSDPKIVGGTLEFLPHAGYLPLREAAWSWEEDINPDGPARRVPLWRGRPGPKWGFGMVSNPWRTHGFYGHGEWSVIVPHWFVALVTGLLPLWWVRSGRWRRHVKPGHCRSCGYDLRGNASGTCPECGTPVESKPVPQKIPDISN